MRTPVLASRVVLSRQRLVNHPGHPDQKVHGGGSGGPHPLSGDQALRDAYTYRDEKTGMFTQVVSVNHWGDRYTSVGIGIYDRNENLVGTASREFDDQNPTTVQHSGLTLNEGMQGQGFATRFNDHAEAAYRAAGVDRIELNANIDVGGYAWARAGYDFAESSSRKHGGGRASIASRARKMAGNYDREVGAQIERVASNPRSSPIEFAMIGHTPGATMWPGKEIMLGSSWDAEKKL